MSKQLEQLNIGDEIGFVQFKNDVDSVDEVIYFPVCEITERDGEIAYRYKYPDGNISSAPLPHSRIETHLFQVRRKNSTQPAANLQICLNDRRDEFKKALRRGLDNDFQVYAGWDRDTFFVVNKTKKSEYRVEFETIEGRLYAECECKDFFYRKHICKHIAEVLQETLFGLSLTA